MNAAQASTVVYRPGQRRSDTRARLARVHVHGDAKLATLFLGVAAVSRGLLLSNYAGESDSAWFITDFRQWLRYGPHGTDHNVFAVRYYRELSAGYFWLADHLARLFHVMPQHLPLLLNSISYAATLLSAPILYLLARRVVSQASACAATLLFLLAPAFWWLGIEPHPEGPAIALLLLSFYCFLRAWQIPALESQKPGWGLSPRPRLGWWVATLLSLTASLLVRNDAVLLFPAYAGFLVVAAGQDRRPWRAQVRSLLTAFAHLGALLLAASIAFLVVRSWILGEGMLRSLDNSAGTVRGFWGSSSIPRQIFPMFSGVGLLVSAVAAIGLVFLTVKSPRAVLWRRLALLASWSLPAYAFWFMISGNTARHTILYALVPLWLGCAGWELLGRRALFAAVAVALALDLFVIPANSNLTLYPSANVPLSVHYLRQRHAEMKKFAENLAQPADRDGQACYIGDYTTPFLISDLLEQFDTSKPVDGDAASTVRLLQDGPKSETLILAAVPQPATIHFRNAYTPAEYLSSARLCQRSRSLDFEPNGRHRWFIGSELANSRVYAAASAILAKLGLRAGTPVSHVAASSPEGAKRPLR